MNKVLISVLGSDQPGIMAAVTRVVQQRDGNIENLSQTLLGTVFGALLQVEVPANEDTDALQQAIETACGSMNLFIRVHAWNEKPSQWHEHPLEVQPYIITAIGPDRQGLVAEVTEKVFKHGVNITNMQAIFEGGRNPMANLMVFEVDVPRATVLNNLREELHEVADKLELEISVQHRRIFESVSNILN